MARIWQTHTPGMRRTMSTNDGLVQHPVYHVRVCGFEFVFRRLSGIDEAIGFYSAETHPSSRLARKDFPPGFLEAHRDVQRWYEMVPLRLQREANRRKVLAALQAARELFG
jgi:hypothetical protein